MATITLGTSAQTTLTAVKFSRGLDLSDADIATIAQKILTPEGPGTNTPVVFPGAFARTGLLFVPNRGVLQCKAGDYVGVDPSGVVVLVPRYAIATTATATGNTHTSTLVDSLSTNVLLLNWYAGMVIAGSGITAGTKIASIAAGGLSLVLTAATSSTLTGTTLTVGSWVHT